MDREEINRRRRERWWKYREKSHQWKVEHKETIKEVNRRSREKEKESGKAYIHNRCEYIIKRNNLRPNECSICGGNTIVSAHHPTYEKPNEVIFVCSPCHRRIHSGLLEFDKSIIVDLNKYGFTKHTNSEKSTL